MVSAVIFDWDNTLVDSWKIMFYSINSAFDHFGLPNVSQDELKSNAHYSMRDYFPKILGKDQWEEIGAKYYEYYLAHHLDYIKPLSDAEMVLETLREKNIYTAIVSNKKGPILRKEVEALNWGKYMQRIIGSLDAVQDKPALEPVHMALDKLQTIDKSTILFVGDSIVDIECAVKFGCKPVLFGDKVAAPNVDSLYPGYAHVVNHKELLNYF